MHNTTANFAAFRCLSLPFHHFFVRLFSAFRPLTNAVATLPSTSFTALHRLSLHFSALHRGTAVAITAFHNLSLPFVR